MPILTERKVLGGAAIPVLIRGDGQPAVPVFIVGGESGFVTDAPDGSNYLRTLGSWVAAGSAALSNSGDFVAVTRAEPIIVAASDEGSDIATGFAKVTFRMPYAMTLTSVRANVNTAPSGSSILIDINKNGSTILSTRISIDSATKTSLSAATQPVISDTALANDDEITIDFDAVGSVDTGKGVKVTLIGTRI